MPSTMTLLLFLSNLIFAGCASPAQTSTTSSKSDINEASKTKPQPIYSYLALGDSYTIGQSVSKEERWPILLAKAIQKKGKRISPPHIIAQTGWRTDHLLDAMKSELDTNKKFDLVSILIGVNNQFQDQSILVYEKELRSIFDLAIVLSKRGKSGVFVVSIPDYGASPYAASQSPQAIGKAIDKWNVIYKKVSKEYGLSWHNITAISRQAIDNKDMVASDGLHPAGKMYQMWVNKILEDILFRIP